LRALRRPERERSRDREGLVGLANGQLERWSDLDRAAEPVALAVAVDDDDRRGRGDGR
jgi:hypothetical protein